MGQTLGRAPLPPGCKRFLNLPRSCIYDLWEAFNDIAEGFGLTIDEFQEILKSALMEYLAVTERTLNGDTDLVFRAFDDDENNLVDSLEFLSSFALLSGMTPEEKVRFIFAMYDFDETQLLSLDEMVLAFRSTLSGLSKLSKIDPPTEAEVEVRVNFICRKLHAQTLFGKYADFFSNFIRVIFYFTFNPYTLCDHNCHAFLTQPTVGDCGTRFRYDSPKTRANRYRFRLFWYRQR